MVRLYKVFFVCFRFVQRYVQVTGKEEGRGKKVL